MLHRVSTGIAVGKLAGADGKMRALSLMEMCMKAGVAGFGLADDNCLSGGEACALLDWTTWRYGVLADVESGSYTGAGHD